VNNFGNLRTWLRQWRAEQAIKKFDAGRQFALDQLAARSDGVDYLEQKVEEAKDFGDYNEFDKGIESVLNKKVPT